MIYPYEKFIINLFIWLFLVLGILILFTFFIIVRKKNLDTFLVYKKKPVKNALRLKKRNKITGSDTFKEKLGEKVVQYMIEVSQSNNPSLVKDRIKRIRDECERLGRLKLPEESKRIITSVLVWAKKFDIDRHMSEMKVYKHSTQIIYDFKKHDFQLRVSMD